MCLKQHNLSTPLQLQSQPTMHQKKKKRRLNKELCYNLKARFITKNALNAIKYILMNFETQSLSKMHTCGYKAKVYMHMISICLQVN